jgi:hypothetical protein
LLDLVQVGDHRAAFIGQREQPLAQPGHGGGIDPPAAVRTACRGTRRTRMIRALSGPICVSCRLQGFPAGMGRPMPAAHAHDAAAPGVRR